LTAALKFGLRIPSFALGERTASPPQRRGTGLRLRPEHRSAEHVVLDPLHRGMDQLELRPGEVLPRVAGA
jgi:hypothetical protein